jgi:hypothetical protein
MSMQKLPVIGTFFKNQVPVPGQTGVNALTGATVAPAATEVTISRFLLSGAAIVLDGTTATVTLASHLNTIVGQQVTFSGATGVTALNGQTWTISQIVSASVYRFPCTLTGTVTGTIVQEPVFTLPQGHIIVRMAANANVEYNSDNGYISPSGSATAPTWKIQVVGNATPVVALVVSDGFATRIRCMGTTASSFFNVVN